MKNNRKKKAFTLTELLVVVIVIGVLSAVVLPKFSKVIETRKTTEAEEMMAAVRTEQERRCALDKNYTIDAATVNLASLNTKNFNYTLKNTGIEAKSKNSKYGYTLKMPSYRDGRLCCDSAEQCAKLNKNYPLCSELTAKADYTIGEECSAAEEPNPPKPCEGPSEEKCGCNKGGNRTRTCDTTTGIWSTWGDCSIAETCECDRKNQPSASTSCNTCGEKTRTVTCDVTTGEWKTSSWGDCSVSSPSQCGGGGNSNPGSAQSAMFLVFSDDNGSAYYSRDSSLCGCGCDRKPVKGTAVNQYCANQREADRICAQGGTGCFLQEIPFVPKVKITTGGPLTCIHSRRCFYTDHGGSTSGGWTVYEGAECDCPGRLCSSDGERSIKCSGVSEGSCVDGSCKPVPCGNKNHKCFAGSGVRTCTVPSVASIPGFICSNYTKSSNDDVCGGLGGGCGASCDTTTGGSSVYTGS